MDSPTLFQAVSPMEDKAYANVVAQLGLAKRVAEELEKVVQDKNLEIATLNAHIAAHQENLKWYEAEKGVFQDVEMFGGRIVFKGDTIRILEAMDAFVRAAHTGKFELLISKLKEV